MSGQGNTSYHAALASAARRRILDALRDSTIGLDAHSLSRNLSLHVTTVRFHLEQLEKNRLVNRRSVPARRRGRPPILYTLAGAAREEQARNEMIGVLSGIVGDNDPDRSVRAGHLWADTLDRADAEPATMTDVLDHLGFAPETDGNTTRLLGCPFRDAARRHPEVVCSVHRGLLEGLLAHRDPHGESAVGLEPFVEPELCLVSITRRTPGTEEAE